MKKTQLEIIKMVARGLRGIELTSIQLERAYKNCKKSPSGSTLKGQDFYDRVKEYFIN